MPHHPAFTAGLTVFFVSMAVFMGLVFSKGGWNRMRQIGVIVALMRGEHGKTARVVAIGSLSGIVFGALFLFAGVAAEDVAREKRCQARCVASGHLIGKIGPSVEQSMTRRNTPAFVACTCTGGEGPSIELRADSL